MAAAYSFPVVAGYSFDVAANLSDPSTRARLSPVGFKAFGRIMERWGIRDEDARRLLGSISSGSFYELKRSAGKRSLSQDTLTRISFIIGIYKALHILYSPKLANAWITCPNSNPMFHGLTPLAYMLQLGQPGMMHVRQLLDSRRGGR